MQPLLDRINLSAERQQFFEHDLRGYADEFHQFGIGLFIGLIRIGLIAAGAGDLGEVADDFPHIPAERLEIGDVPRPYRKPVHHKANALARPFRGCSSSGSNGSNSMPCSPKDEAVAENTFSIIAEDSSERAAPSGRISLSQSCIL